MKQVMWAIGLIVVLLAGPALPAEAAGGGGSHGGGSMSGGGFHGGGGGATAGSTGARGSSSGAASGGGAGRGGGDRGIGEPSYPYYTAPSVVVQQAPTGYTQQEPAPPAAPQYWYYCQKAGAYYPYVKDCPGGWMPVVPQPAPPGP